MCSLSIYIEFFDYFLGSTGTIFLFTKPRYGGMLERFMLDW